MDMLSKIKASWITGENAEFESGDGRKVKIKDGVNHVLSKANEIEMARSRSKTISNDREADNEIGSK